MFGAAAGKCQSSSGVDCVVDMMKKAIRSHYIQVNESRRYVQRLTNHYRVVLSELIRGCQIDVIIIQ